MRRYRSLCSKRIVRKRSSQSKSARRHQRSVKPRMHARPQFVMAVVFTRRKVGSRFEFPPRRFERGSPRCVASRDRAAQGETFEFDARMRHVAEIGQRQRAHSKAALILDNDQSVGNEPRQGFPHRDRADREPLGERADEKPLARFIATGQDVRAQASVDRRRQSPRPALEALQGLRQVEEERRSDCNHGPDVIGERAEIVNNRIYIFYGRISDPVTTLGAARCGLSLDNADRLLRSAVDGLHVGDCPGATP